MGPDPSLHVGNLVFTSEKKAKKAQRWILNYSSHICAQETIRQRSKKKEKGLMNVPTVINWLGFGITNRLCFRSFGCPVLLAV